MTATDPAPFDAFNVIAMVDLNGDGLSELVVGASTDDAAAIDAGELYVYNGTPDGLDLSTERRITASDASAGDAFGSSGADAGDLDGDGWHDLVVAAVGDDEKGPFSGSFYVYYGSKAGIDVARELKVVTDDTDDYYGFANFVSGAGDLDGDGYDDLVIGSGGAGPLDAGFVHIYYGGPGGLDVAREQKLEGSDSTSSDFFGSSVAGVGDLDGDGFDDIAVGADGRSDVVQSGGQVYVYYGSPSGLDPDSEQELRPAVARLGALFGYRLAAAGDVDGDGTPDLLVTAPGDGEGAPGAGAAYVYYGAPSGFDNGRVSKIIASDADVVDTLGTCAVGAGDVDGDGYDDVLIGANADDEAGQNAGAAYLYHGGPLGIDLASEEKLLAFDAAASDFFGSQAAGGGDIDGNGVADIAVGSAGAVDGQVRAGAVYLYLSVCDDLDADGACAGMLDCDDADAAVFGGATELVGDEVDSDCDGAELCLADADGDGYTDGSVVASADADCADPGEAAASVPGGDCNDEDESRFPGAADAPDDGVDSDCDGADPRGTTPQTTDTAVDDVPPPVTSPDGCGCSAAGPLRGWGLLVVALGAAAGRSGRARRPVVR